MITISVAELEEREKRLEQEINEKQDLLDAMRKTRIHIQTGESFDGTAFVKTVKKLQSSSPRYGENTRLVRRAIKQMTHNYTIKDIRKNLTDAGTPLSNQSLATVLNRLKKTGVIQQIKKGKGRRPAIFKL